MTGKQSISRLAANLGFSFLLALALICIFYGLFTLVVPRLFKQPGWQRNRDLPILLAMILALGCAWGAHQVNLSPALGAFAGGVLLAVSPFATQIRADVRPLSTVLVTLFFASIGMFGDPWWLLENWMLVTGIVMAIVVGKPLVIAILSRAFGQPWRYAIATGLCLAQIGEFSFVLATIAQTEIAGTALMSPTTFRALVTATIISLLLTPYLVAVAQRAGSCVDGLLSRLAVPQSKPPLQAVPPPDALQVASDAILIIGFGPAGQRVAEGLISSYQSRIVVVDLNQDHIAIAHRYGLKGILGDATQTEILEHAGVSDARLVVIVLPDLNTSRQLIDHVRDLAPNAQIIVRCRYHLRHWELLNAGADEVVDEEDEVGKQLAARVREVLPSEIEPST
jgi:CPA2 family monovalent cation:H+ antiporter-2